MGGSLRREPQRCSPCPPSDAWPSDPEADRDLARLARALSHPVRVGIVRLLASQQRCLYGDLADRLPLAKSTVSQHLAILKESGLVRGEVEGPRACYCIDAAGLRRLQAHLAGLAGPSDDGFPCCEE